MNRLIKASLLRMKKSKTFLFSVIFQIGFALFVIIPTYGTGFSIGNMMIADSLISMLLSTLFVPFFLHDDHHKGMMRNKIITGHTRTQIYASNYISALIGSSVIFIVPIIVAFALAPFFGGHIGVTAAEFAFRLITTLAANGAMCGIYVWTAFLCRNLGSAASFFIAFAMFIVSIFCTLIIESPEDAAEIFESFETIGISVTVDPSSALNKALYDVLPTSHLVRIMVSEHIQIRDIAFLPFYSVLVIAVTVIAGVLLFRRKDLK